MARRTYNYYRLADYDLHIHVTFDSHDAAAKLHCENDMIKFNSDAMKYYPVLCIFHDIHIFLCNINIQRKSAILSKLAGRNFVGKKIFSLQLIIAVKSQQNHECIGFLLSKLYNTVNVQLQAGIRALGGCHHSNANSA